MARRSTPQKKTDELAFPIRVRFVVPPRGFGNRLNDLHKWLKEETGTGNYAVHPSNGLATGGMAVHLRMAEDAQAVVKAFPDFVLADGVDGVAYSSPYKQAEEPDVCGRFTLHHTWAEVHAAMSIIPDADLGRNTAARYNITPTQDVLFVAQGKDGEIVLKEGRWWLVPVWAKELPKYPLFNARSETAHEKSSFKLAFQHKRCLIPADGFYEWTKELDDEGKEYKQPHYIRPADEKPFMFAGLWAYNKPLDILSCTILTAKPDPAIAEIHDRMPIILQDGVFEEWMAPKTPVDDARELLKQHRGGELIHYRVGTEVNSNNAKGSDLITPV